MRIRINFETSESKIVFPVHYNHILQGFIYSCIDDDLAEFLHEKGYVYGKRRFKLFTFSRLMGSCSFDRNNKKLVYNSSIYFIIASPLESFLESLVRNMLKGGEIKMNSQTLYVSSVEVLPLPDLNTTASVKIKMLSPITVYSTLTKTDGKKKTYYYNPYEREFAEQITENLRKKYVILRGNDEGFVFEIKPKNVKSRDEKIIIYKQTVIKGWMGTYTVKGSIDVLKTAYDTGIGSKNSQGFGMFEIIG